MLEPLRIRAEEAKPDSDTLVVRLNRPVAPGAPQYCSSAEDAADFPLARALLAVPGLEAVLLQEESITLLKPVGGPPWPTVVSEVCRTIEEHFAAADREAADQLRASTPEEKQLAYAIQEHLNIDINPLVASHGGFIEVLDVRGEVLYIHMRGGCHGCGMASTTVKQGVETSVRKKFPTVKSVLDTTDHASGKNPYYARAEH